METDSPNLFDSEPVPVELTAVAAAATNPVDSDDVLAEIIEEIRDGDGPSGVEISVHAGNDRDAVEYRTDESDDENEDAVEDQPADADRSAGGEHDEDSAKSKTRDVHKGLPPGRVKLIMKMDPDVNIVAGDAVFLLTKATVIRSYGYSVGLYNVTNKCSTFVFSAQESFVALLAQHCHKAMVASNKKTMKKQHIDAVIEENVPFEFLDGALDW